MSKGSFRYLAAIAVALVCVAVEATGELEAPPTLPCPTHCVCDFKDKIYNCTVGNASFTVLLRYGQPEKVWMFICQGDPSSEVKCSDMPQINEEIKTHYLFVNMCSPRVLACVEHVFYRALVNFTNLELHQLSEPLRAEHVTLQKHIINLDITLTNETTFPREAVSALPELRSLKVKNGKMRLTSNDLNGTDLHELTLFHNNVNSLPTDFFKGSSHMKNLYISGEFNKIDADTFLGLESLQKLTMTYTEIKSIEIGAFAATPNLYELYLYSTKLMTLPNGLFEGLGALTKLTIDTNSDVELSLDSHVFSPLKSLRVIYIGSCGLTSLPEELFTGSTNIEKILLSNNNISGLPSKVFSNLFNLKELDLSYNEIEEIPDRIFADLQALTVLNLNFNKIRWFTVSGLSNLTSLSLKNNDISHIVVYGYSRTYHYKTSEAIYDDRHHDYEIRGFQIKSFPQLKRLDLSGNHISYLSHKVSSLKHIKWMDLSRNSFEDIEEFKVDFSDLDIIIDLEHNNITDMTLDPRVYPTNASHESIRGVLVLKNNPITCDCNILGMYRRANWYRPRETEKEPIFRVDGLKCHSPPSLAGQLLTDVSPDSFVCDLPDYCPANCTCTARAITNELIIDCLEVPSTMNKTDDKDFPYKYFEKPRVTLNLKYQPDSIRHLNIHKLNLSNTGLNEINFTRTKSLKILDLSHNKLTRIPSEFLEPNIYLYLSDNPLECDCFLVKSLKRTGLVADLEEVRCVTGDKLSEIDILELCSRTNTLITGVGTTAVGSLFLLIIAKTIYAHLNDIRSFMSRNILCKRGDADTTRTEMRLDETKQFDLFISYAHQDEEFISETLLPTLENKYKQKVCVHSRDWLVGDMITDQIINSVDCSRRTIIILTENFLASEWSYLEFRTAHNLSIREGRPRVIIILLDEAIARDERLDNDLKSYIAVNTYLVVGDPNFWEKLKKVLPTPRRN